MTANNAATKLAGRVKIGRVKRGRPDAAKKGKRQEERQRDDKVAAWHIGDPLCEDDPGEEFDAGKRCSMDNLLSGYLVAAPHSSLTRDTSLLGKKAAALRGLDLLVITLLVVTLLVITITAL